MTRFGPVLVVLAVVDVVVLSGQAPAGQSSLAFEVASIKVRTTAAGAGSPASPDRFIGTNQSLRDLIQYAYGLQRFQIIGGADWVSMERFDVDAKASFVPSPEQMRLMVQRLLAARFALKVSRATREMDVFSLVRARSSGPLGPQQTRTTAACAAIEAERTRRGEEAPRRGATERPVCATWLAARPGPNGLTLRYQTSGTTSSELAAFLSSYAGRAVLDRTGLTGEFDIDLSFAPQGALSASAPPVDAPPTIFTAVQEQLGLRLDATRGPVEVLLIDSVERPTPD